MSDLFQFMVSFIWTGRNYFSFGQVRSLKSRLCHTALYSIQSTLTKNLIFTSIMAPVKTKLLFLEDYRQHFTTQKHDFQSCQVYIPQMTSQMIWVSSVSEKSSYSCYLFFRKVSKLPSKDTLWWQGLKPAETGTSALQK